MYTMMSFIQVLAEARRMPKVIGNPLDDLRAEALTSAICIYSKVTSCLNGQLEKFRRHLSEIIDDACVRIGMKHVGDSI